MAHTRQRQTPSTRGKFATVVAEEIQKIIVGSFVDAASNHMVLI